MGNSLSSLPIDSTSKLEYKNGKRLISAIAMNSKEATDNAIEFARKECVKPQGIYASVMEYEDMVKTMLEYLTRKYHCGDDRVWMTPLEYATSCNATIASESVASAIAGFETARSNTEHAAVGTKTNTAKESLRQRQLDREYEQKGWGPAAPPEPHEKVVIGEVTKERAQEAKARLIAFRATKDEKK